VAIQCHKGSNSTAQWRSSSEREPPNHSSLPKYRSVLNLTLPLDAAGYYLLAVGELTHGSVELQEAPPSKARKEHIQVSIDARYYTKDAFQKLTICELDGESGTRGLGIYVRICASRRLTLTSTPDPILSPQQVSCRSSGQNNQAALNSVR